MAHYTCIVQAGQAPLRERARLAEGLKRIAHDELGEAPEVVEIRWIRVEEGFGFTAGEPSTSTLVARSVAEGYPDAARERLMTKVCDLWQEVTGCTADEIVVTAWDGPLPL